MLNCIHWLKITNKTVLIYCKAMVTVQVSVSTCSKSNCPCYTFKSNLTLTFSVGILFYSFVAISCFQKSFRDVCMLQKQMETDLNRSNHPNPVYFEDMQETERYCVNVKHERKQEEEKDDVIFFICSHNVKNSNESQRSDNPNRSSLIQKYRESR